MPRRAAASIRPVEPDPVHRSKLVQQIINKVMLDGKKSTAERIVYDSLAIIAERTGRDRVEYVEQSVKTLTPQLEVRSRRVGGATYQVPVEVPARRARTLAVRWLVTFARQRREKSMAQRLANELWMRSPSRAAPSSARTTSSAWRRPTRPSPTTAGSAAAELPSGPPTAAEPTVPTPQPVRSRFGSAAPGSAASLTLSYLLPRCYRPSAGRPATPPSPRRQPAVTRTILAYLDPGSSSMILQMCSAAWPPWASR